MLAITGTIEQSCVIRELHISFELKTDYYKSISTTKWTLINCLSREIGNTVTWNFWF